MLHNTHQPQHHMRLSWPAWQQRHRGAAAATLLLLLTLCCSPASAASRWHDDADAGSSSSLKSRSGGSTWGGGGSSSPRLAADGVSVQTAAGTFTPGPPPAPSRSSDDASSSKKSHGKGEELQPGFSGGFLPKTHRCDNPNLPGCQSCTGDVCNACYAVLGDASFILSPETHQCMCPPGYGKVEGEDSAQHWWSRRLSGLGVLDAPASSSDSSGSDGAFTAEQQGMQLHSNTASLAAVVQGQLTPPPPWATDCLPCPVDYYSSGGSIGFAQCKPCPGAWTTGNATASTDCIVPYCEAGRSSDRRAGRCGLCAFGTYRPASAANRSCIACPSGFTTPTRGSTSLADCRVPICKPGQQLDVDLFLCIDCTGNTVSPGGTRANGPYQPFCRECPTFTAASTNRTECFDDTCPPPDAFSIVCRTNQVPACGPGAKPFLLDSLCTAFPVGAQLQWYRAEALYEASTGNALYNLGTTIFQPPIVTCPAGANGTTVWWPAITSFKERTNCFCSIGATTCRFTTTTSSTPPAGSAAVTTNPAVNVTVYDPQLASLRWMLGSIDPANYTTYGARLGGYCLSLTATTTPKGNFSLSCVGPHLSSFDYQPWPYAINGTLPAALRVPGLSHLREFNCTNCGLTGSLPPDWGTSNNLAALKFLSLGGNAFTGTLPPEWGGLTNLVNLTLSSGGVMPEIPSFWSNMRSLAFVNFAKLQLASGACAPLEWERYNGLVKGETLLPASLDFCSS